MEETKPTDKSEAIIHSVSSWLNVAGASVLFALTILTVADVSLRYFLNRPIKGVFELTELMMVAIVILGLGYTAATHGHVTVELITSRLSHESKRVIQGVTHVLSIFIVSLIVWQSALYAFSSMRVGEHSDILKVPTFYFKFLIPIGFFILALELIIGAIESFKKRGAQ